MTQLQIPWRKKPLQHPHRIMLASVYRKKVVGVVIGMTDSEVTYLTDLFVMEKYRGKGRGRELMDRFMEAAKGTTVVLLTQQGPFYKKFGFSKRECWAKKA